MINNSAPSQTPTLTSPGLQAVLERWIAQAEEIASHPMRPIHPDPHWHNYVICRDRLFLLDWDLLDLSDPLRDVGIQVWGFAPYHCWPEVLQRVRLPADDRTELAIYWWAAFKMIMNSHWNDRRGDDAAARFHAEAFRKAVERRPWLPEQLDYET